MADPQKNERAGLAKIKEIIAEALRCSSGVEQKDYEAVWAAAVPAKIRRHTHLLPQKEEVVIFVDNPTTHHLLSLQTEKVLAFLQKERLPVKKITIKQNNTKGRLV